MQTINAELTSSLEPSMRIDVLPQTLLDVVKEMCCCQQAPCSCPPCEIYAEGSQVLNILNGVESQATQDYDFLMITHSSQWLQMQAFSTFIPARLSAQYIRNTKRHGGVSADLKILSTTLSVSAYARDYTISALFIRVNGLPHEIGQVFDPTGRGLADLRAKRLATINRSPADYYRINPISVLRGCKFMGREYAPDLEVSEALQQWFDSTWYENDHFVSVLMNQLESPHHLAFIQQMNAYGLVDKLYWPSIRTDNPEDTCKKLLSQLYRRYYLRKIAKDAPLVMPPLDEVSTESVSIAKQNAEIAADRRGYAQSFFDQLNIREIGSRYKINQIEQENVACQERLVVLTSQIEEHKEQLAQKQRSKAALLEQVEIHAEKLAGHTLLQRELDTLNAEIERQITEKVDENTAVRNLRLTDARQALLQEQQALSDAKESNRTLQVAIDELRLNHSAATSRVQQNEDRLALLSAENQRLSGILKKKKSRKARKTAVKVSNSTEISQDLPLEPETATPSIEIDQPFDVEYEHFFSQLGREELESLLDKTILLDFRVVIAYQLGHLAYENRDYFKALNYFNLVLSIYPQQLKTQALVRAIKRECSTIDWSDKDARAWRTKAAAAKKAKQMDEAMAFYTQALQCDTQCVNAYVGRINLFYKQNQWIAFIEDYERLLAIIAELEKTPGKTMQDSVIATKDALVTMIQDAVYQQISTQSDIEPRDVFLSATWNRSITIKIAHAPGIPPLQERMICYIKILALDLNKKIAYGIAQFELARCYAYQREDKSAALHYYEALQVVSCFQGAMSELEAFIPDHFGCKVLETAAEYFQEGTLCREQYCYYSALILFNKCITYFPADRKAYWANINCCYAMHRTDLIKDGLLDALIQNYNNEREILAPFDYWRPLIELYVYKADYQNARIALASAREYCSDEAAFFCVNLKQTLSVSLIDALRNENKQRYLQLQADEAYMCHPENRLKVTRELVKIAIDECQVPPILKPKAVRQAINAGIAGTNPPGTLSSASEGGFFSTPILLPKPIRTGTQPIGNLNSLS